MDSGLFLFYYSIAVQVCSILTAAICFASYLVSRNKVQLFAFAGFLMYYCDCMLVFRDDYLMASETVAAQESFFIGDPVSSIVFGCAFLTAFWFLVCEYVEAYSRVLRVAPAVVFVVSSSAVSLFMPQSYLHMFVFYSLREVYMAWILLFGAYRYITVEKGRQRMRLRKFARFYVLLWVLVLAIVVENVIFLLIINPSMPGMTLAFFPERNFAENALALTCAFVAIRSAMKYLFVRHTDPPRHEGEHVEAFIDLNLFAYATGRKLSPRETEILRLVLIGKDNQNIANELSLAPGTVKVHIHHILQKTQMGNRQELIQDFWDHA